MSKWEKDEDRSSCPICDAECEVLVEEEERWDGRVVKYVKAERCSEGCYYHEF